MRFEPNEKLKKSNLLRIMCRDFADNIDIGKNFLNYTISRANIALMRDSISKVKPNKFTLEEIKIPQKYNLRKYGF